MATNLDIDQALLREAVKAGRHRSKKDAVTEALREYVARRKQQEALKMFGEVDYFKDYDYRAHRRRA